MNGVAKHGTVQIKFGGRYSSWNKDEKTLVYRSSKSIEGLVAWEFKTCEKDELRLIVIQSRRHQDQPSKVVSQTIFH